MEVAGKSLPALTNLDKGRYSVIVFENYHRYLNMDKWNRELLDKYCREYGVGVLGFFPPAERHATGIQVKGFPLYLHTKLSLRVSAKKKKKKQLFKPLLLPRRHIFPVCSAEDISSSFIFIPRKCNLFTIFFLLRVSLQTVLLSSTPHASSCSFIILYKMTFGHFYSGL